MTATSIDDNKNTIELTIDQEKLNLPDDEMTRLIAKEEQDRARAH